MKKIIYITFILTVLASINLNAKEHYKGPISQNNADSANNNYISSPYLDGARRVSVSELKNLQDDEIVVLQGYITKRIKPEKFLFEDSTGKIRLDIDNKINYQLEGVNEKTLVEIRGELEKEVFGPNEIEVKNIIIVK